jgi:hypothetical protein
LYLYSISKKRTYSGKHVINNANELWKNHLKNNRLTFLLDKNLETVGKFFNGFEVEEMSVDFQIHSAVCSIKGILKEQVIELQQPIGDLSGSFRKYGWKVCKDGKKSDIQKVFKVASRQWFDAPTESEMVIQEMLDHFFDLKSFIKKYEETHLDFSPINNHDYDVAVKKLEKIMKNKEIRKRKNRA